jgi:hypothetical protein
MAETTIEQILNFLIPIGVWIFLGWIIYRVPIIKEGVGKLRDKISERRERIGGDIETSTIRSITYE